MSAETKITRKNTAKLFFKKYPLSIYMSPKLQKRQGNLSIFSRHSSMSA